MFVQTADSNVKKLQEIRKIRKEEKAGGKKGLALPDIKTYYNSSLQRGLTGL